MGDLVVRGPILTLDRARPLATALWARDGRIVAVGDEQTILADAPRGAFVIDAREALVLPGLRDGHAHLASLGRLLETLDLRGLRSPSSIAERVREAAQAPFAGASAACLPDGDGWIEGRGWDQNLFDPPLYPPLRLLDEAAGDRPVYLERVDGHAAWINSAAAARAGLLQPGPDPAGGRVPRDADGRPSGVVIDRAMELVKGAIPPLSPAAHERRLLRALAKLEGDGLVEVHDMGTDRASLDALGRLAARDELRLRVVSYLEDGPLLDQADGPLAGPPPPRGPWLTLQGVKLYADGALGSRGAALVEEYADDPGNRGLLLTPPERIAAIAQRAVQSGWQLAIHAIGDRACGIALDAFERAVVADRARALAARLRLEHAQIVRDEDVSRMARLGVLASVQPAHAVADRAWAPLRLGERRLAHAYRLRSFTRAAIRLVAGSDAPVESSDPRAGLAAAVWRVDRDGLPHGGFRPEEALTMAEAIAAFTTGPSFAAFAESERGVLREGMACDLTIFEDPAGTLLREGSAAWLAAPLSATVVAGRFVAERGEYRRG